MHGALGRDPDPASQLLHRGFVHFPGVYSASLVEELRAAIDVNLEPDLKDAYTRLPFQGSSHQLEKVYDSSIVRLVSEPAAIDALASCGISSPKYRDGYILSKPPNGHALYWHRDWGCWVKGGPADEETVPTPVDCSLCACIRPCLWLCGCVSMAHIYCPEQVSPHSTQVFMMLYLVATSPRNGCLRVIPGSHLRRISLDDETTTAGISHLERLEGVHGGRHWADDLATDPSLAEALQQAVAQQAGAVDVPVKAGDLVVGDARLYHAAYANRSTRRRTCITMWWLDWDRCGPAFRAHSSHGPMPVSGPIGPCRLPVRSEEERALLAPYHMDTPVKRSSTVGRLIGDWGMTPERSPASRLPRL